MKLLLQNALRLESMIKHYCSVYDWKDHHFTITRHGYKKILWLLATKESEWILRTLSLLEIGAERKHQAFGIIFFLTQFSLICPSLKAPPVTSAARSDDGAILTCCMELRAILLCSSVDKPTATRNATALPVLFYLHCDSAYRLGNHYPLF